MGKSKNLKLYRKKSKKNKKYITAFNKKSRKRLKKNKKNVRRTQVKKNRKMSKFMKGGVKNTSPLVKVHLAVLSNTEETFPILHL